MTILSIWFQISLYSDNDQLIALNQASIYHNSTSSEAYPRQIDVKSALWTEIIVWIWLIPIKTTLSSQFPSSTSTRKTRSTPLITTSSLLIDPRILSKNHRNLSISPMYRQTPKNLPTSNPTYINTFSIRPHNTTLKKSYRKPSRNSMKN